MIRSIVKAAGVAVIAGGLLAAAPKQPQPKSKSEVEALQAMFNAQTPDARIAAADALLSKFSDTEFKAIALQIAAASAQQKNDFEKMVIYSERTLEADPENYPAMLMLAQGYAQRTREFDFDKEEKLTKSEKYANNAIALINKAEKPRPDISDDQWNAAKKDYLAQAHEALGMAAGVRKKYDVAINEYKTAIETGSTQDQATFVRLAAVQNEANKPDDALATITKLMALPDLNPAVKQYADQEKNKAMKLKSGALKPAAPAAPAQVEIKK